MIISIGHHAKQQGLEHDFTSEALESALFAGRLAENIKDCIVAPIDKLKNRIKFCNTICDSLNVELHFASQASEPLQVKYNPDLGQSLSLAARLQESINEYLKTQTIIRPAFYENKSEFGKEWLFKSLPNAIIVEIFYWENVNEYILSNKKYVKALSYGLLSLVNKNVE